ncbi:PIG-S family GPI transamidase component [Mesorhizobium qingshengii]|jgi:hypothetical protein|uniref:PIG-S family GPI transamidase component n=1 Tax=Mesorhizobium qingshengii TaxID=1165689 RepID=A0ABT4R2D2_9HYPH|nr:hypothetical protein [Mesorhizobium qingshengii]MCZ8547906.1 PIG-S family GPI transamidase component [Mesorhizobium qingshengii]
MGNKGWAVLHPCNVNCLLTDHLEMMIVMQNLMRQSARILGSLIVNVSELREWKIDSLKRRRMRSKCQQQHHQSDGCSN